MLVRWETKLVAVVLHQNTMAFNQNVGETLLSSPPANVASSNVSKEVKFILIVEMSIAVTKLEVKQVPGVQCGH